MPLTGEVSFDTIDQYLKTDLGEAQTLDLSGLEELDSTLVALILRWSRQKAASGKKLTVTNAPNQLTSLIELYGLQEIIRTQ